MCLFYYKVTKIIQKYFRKSILGAFQKKIQNSKRGKNYKISPILMSQTSPNYITKKARKSAKILIINVN